MPAGLFAAIPKASVIAGFCPSSPSPFPPQSPPTSQCDSHHSHIAAQATIYTPMRQPPLTHNRLADAPKKQQPQKTVTLRATQPTKHPTLPTMCQPPLTHNHPNTPSTPQCASHLSHITTQTTIHTPMCQPPLTHSHPNTPSTPQCASHHSHTADQPTLPRNNNRRKQPLPQPTTSHTPHTAHNVQATTRTQPTSRRPQETTTAENSHSQSPAANQTPHTARNVPATTHT